MARKEGDLLCRQMYSALGGRRGGNWVLGNQTLMYRGVKSKIPKVSEENSGDLK